MSTWAGNIFAWDLRLVLQPWVMFNLLQPWLKVFPIPQLSMGFARLIALMNHFQGALPVPSAYQYLLFSSAYTDFL